LRKHAPARHRLPLSVGRPTSKRIAIKECSPAELPDDPVVGLVTMSDGVDRQALELLARDGRSDGFVRRWRPLRNIGLSEGTRGRSPGDETSGRRGFGVSTIDFRTDPVTARRHRVVSLVDHTDIPDIVWADDEAGCYGVLGRDAKGKQIVVERSGPIRIVSARR